MEEKFTAKLFRPSIYGVLRQNDRILLCETHTPVSVFTNFPGGGIEPGEAPGDALLREFIEETGLEVRIIRALWASLQMHYGHVHPHQQMVGSYWLVESIGGTLRPAGNGADVRKTYWTPVSELTKQPFTSFDREALPAIVTALQTLVSDG